LNRVFLFIFLNIFTNSKIKQDKDKSIQNKKKTTTTTQEMTTRNYLPKKFQKTDEKQKINTSKNE
jgi:hypothetical protein